MNKIKSFIQLDFITVKPYFTIKNISIYAVIALFLAVFSGNASSSIGFGMMIGTLFMSYPFAIGEKSNLDELYAVLSVNRKTVVLGRYLFTLLINCCTFVIFYLLAAAGLFITGLIGYETETGGILLTAAIIAPLAVLIEAVQLPVFFKLGYSKAKFFSLVPFAVIAAGFLAVTALGRSGEADGDFFGNIDNFLASVNIGILMAAAVLIMFLFMFCSYKLSFLFYKKREF